MVDIGVFQNNCTDQDGKCSTKLFLLFLDGRAEKWVEAQPNNVKNSWKVLKPAFLAHFQLDKASIESPQAHYNTYFDHLKLQITFLRHCQEWDKWLRHLLELLMDVLSEMVMQWGLAHTAWTSLPSELQAVIPQPKRGIIEFINTCKSVPWSTYKHILDKHDHREEVVQEIRHHRQCDVEIHRELKNELQHDLATSIEEQFTEITQQTFLDTTQGKANYEATLHDFEACHTHATIQLPKDEPYLLTPGTLPARSNKCHHCGQHGHRQVACINGVVPQPEQNYCQAYGAASYQAHLGNA
ncbi:uncharacterized protein UBRO_20096 [Ustilago bromivora]|uniref:CCHC-type domain-containing protein n=1 Tax=Ustilago bromivora TaxID=307758 RepID=A0A1K0HGD4_9BASI|nr:uncharacterized protein UBRO_20096 [Ustilago bromivora]